MTTRIYTEMVHDCFECPNSDRESDDRLICWLETDGKEVQEKEKNHGEYPIPEWCSLPKLVPTYQKGSDND